METVRQVNREPLIHLLRHAAPQKAQELDRLIAEHNPVFLLDSKEERILFGTNSVKKIITIGVKCTVRLQAHSVAAAIFIAAPNTPGYLGMSPEERAKLYAPAEPFLTWAVWRDLQQRIKQ